MLILLLRLLTPLDLRKRRLPIQAKRPQITQMTRRRKSRGGALRFLVGISPVRLWSLLQIDFNEADLLCLTVKCAGDVLDVEGHDALAGVVVGEHADLAGPVVDHKQPVAPLPDGGGYRLV